MRLPKISWWNSLLNLEWSFKGSIVSDCLMLILSRNNIIWMEADHTLDAKKLTEELEKMTEVLLQLASGPKQSSSLKNKSSPPKAASPSSNNSSHTSRPTKAETKPLEEVCFATPRICTNGRSLRRASLPPSPGLWPTWQRRKRIRYQSGCWKVEKRWEGVYSHHIYSADHFSSSHSTANQLLQRF